MVSQLTPGGRRINQPTNNIISQVFIQVNTEPLEPVDDLPYLGHTITYNNSNWADVYHNLRNSWQHWEVISKVLTKTGVMVRACGILYKAVAQTLLLSRSSSRWDFHFHSYVLTIYVRLY